MQRIAWTRKHAPEKTSGILGQDMSVQRLKRFVGDYVQKKSRKKAALIYGATGSGKTCSVYALAGEMGYEVLELNASDFRNANSINEIIGAASSQRSLLGSGKIILVDELDGISGQKDRGGIAALAKLLGNSAFPIVMTANDPFEKKFSSLRRVSEMMEFRHLSPDNVLTVLEGICRDERIDADAAALRSMANRSGGDMRAAINDLQILSGSGGKLSQDDVDSLSDRNRVRSMIEAITMIFKTTDFEVAASSFDDVSEKPDDWFLWLDENIPSEYRNPADLARAYEKVSSADVFRGRIARSQYWRLLAYIKLLLTAGVALAKDGKQEFAPSYRQSGRLLKIWIAKSRFGKRNNIAEKIAACTHSSPKKVVDDFSYYRTIIKNGDRQKMMDSLGLDEEEIEWLSR